MDHSVGIDLVLKPHGELGLFIAVCGVDGSGKTTQVATIREFYAALGARVVVTHQPSDTARQMPIFERYLFHPEERSLIDYRALVLALLADRLQHVHEVIRPALREGAVVITDRYVFTLLATMIARGYASEWWVYPVVELFPAPDLTFILTADPATAFMRIGRRIEARDRFVEEVHHIRTTDAFAYLAERLGFRTLDTTSMTLNEVSDRVHEALGRLRQPPMDRAEAEAGS